MHDGWERGGTDEHPEEDHVAVSLPVGWGSSTPPAIIRPSQGHGLSGRVVSLREDEVTGMIAGRYRLQTTIGRGAMGEVWRAYDETLGRAVGVELPARPQTPTHRLFSLPPGGPDRGSASATPCGRRPRLRRAGRPSVPGDGTGRGRQSRPRALPGRIAKDEEVACIAARRRQGSPSHEQDVVHGTSSPATFSSTPTGP